MDESLSELGVQQAERVAELLAKRPIAKVCSSPMKRAAETAELIASRHQHAVEKLDGLIEVDVGEWEGMTWREIETQDPARYARFRMNPAEHGYPDGETLDTLLSRTSQTLDWLMRESINEEIVAVAHSVVIRTYMGSLLGMTPKQGYHVPAMNCAVNIVRWKNGKPKPVTVNAVGHLM